MIIQQGNCPAPASKLGNSNNTKPSYDNSTTTQHARILKHFESSPRLTTFAARDAFGIMHPAGRIMELKTKDHVILMYKVPAPDSNGVIHKIGQYTYCGKIDVKNIPWEKIVRDLSIKTNYDKMNLDQRYEFLKKIISDSLSPTQYDAAVKSLSDYLNY